jgi:2-iminobutanoate/2-iminopropanoate deaminase
VTRRRVIEIPNIKHAAPIPSAVVIDNILASSAIFGADQETGTVPAEPSAEVACLFRNIATVLELGGGTVDDIVRMDVFIRDNAIRALVNREWLQMYPDEAYRPARHITVIASLPAQAQVEVLAVLPAGKAGDAR